MIITWLAWASAAAALLALTLTLFNTLVWPRGRRDGAPPERLSVLIPARDEEETDVYFELKAAAATHAFALRPAQRQRST